MHNHFYCSKRTQTKSVDGEEVMLSLGSIFQLFDSIRKSYRRYRGGLELRIGSYRKSSAAAGAGRVQKSFSLNYQDIFSLGKCILFFLIR